IDPTTGALVTAGTQGKSAKSFLTTIKYRPCAADFDGSGFVDLDDFTAFVFAFEAGTDDADFDQSGFVDTDDYDAFVRSFEDGC
ncbi:MAG TPA: GC-type dockerin domain-anchored protein, partial [Phycisphaerales bacterium]|nr:GC-type dockerin domain-anchored protein [Phycisphaerales bacterium]